MLKTRAAASGAAPIARVKAESRPRVAALLRQRRRRKNLAQRVPSAHIAGGIAAGGFAYGRLIDKNHARQLLCAQERVQFAWAFSLLAKMPQKRGCQHALHQGGFARTRHTRDANQALQRNFHIDVLQIIGTHPLQQQLRVVRGYGALQAQPQGFAPT